MVLDLIFTSIIVKSVFSYNQSLPEDVSICIVLMIKDLKSIHVYTAIWLFTLLKVKCLASAASDD